MKPTPTQDKRRDLAHAKRRYANARRRALARFAKPSKELAAWVGGMMVCYAYSQKDTQMLLGAARESGLFPLKASDRKSLIEMLGVERTAEFEKACRRE